MKLFGLRLSRIREFRLVVKEELLSGNARKGAWRKLIKGAWLVILNRRYMPIPPLVKWRLKKCLSCPMREGGTHSPLKCGGCGCYIPYLVSSTEPFNPCPIKQKTPDKGWL